MSEAVANARGQRAWTTGLLDAAGVPVTECRCTILQFLSEADHPMSVRELCERFEPGVQVYRTVYRSINIMCGAGLLARINLGEGFYRYELTSAPDSPAHRYHLICSRCHRMMQFQDCAVAQVVTSISDPMRGFSVNRYCLTFYGICPECQARSGRICTTRGRRHHLKMNK